MIDTIFFLLVFFMMSSLQRITMSAPRVNLPTSTLSGQKPTNKVVISVDRAGTYYVDKQAVAYDSILGMLKERIDRDADLVIVINADRDQQVGDMQGLIDVAKRANPAKLYIATAPSTGDTEQ